MSFVSCPRCQKLIDAPPEYAGATVACPSCNAQFVLPGNAQQQPVVVNVAAAAPARAPQRQSGNEGVIIYLLAGILLCGILLVMMMGLWEMRFQEFRNEVERMKQSFPK